MGKLTGGIDYDMIGRTGNHVGRRVKGVNIISMRPAKSNRPPTQLQLNQRIQFGLITSWLSWISSFIKIGFQNYDADKSPMNAAVGYNLEKAITGVAPNYTIDYEKAAFSRGVLAKAMNLVMATTEDAQLDFTWEVSTNSMPGAATDKAVFIVYNPSKQEFVMSGTGPVRSTLSYDMALPSNFSGDNVQVWMVFVSADGKKVSDTQFIAATVVQ
ncbi:DUF6266 family protein [Pedobacter ginsengisoli]|uniref:DUF6266 family protein n=1 Tax=Pedobacter ginsengisoli TaxID=363852 RepID=UPI00254A8472|nr:DUF6266 family protein [Pedobacter ginsengisoli]